MAKLDEKSFEKMLINCINNITHVGIVFFDTDERLCEFAEAVKEGLAGEYGVELVSDDSILFSNGNVIVFVSDYDAPIIGLGDEYLEDEYDSGGCKLNDFLESFRIRDA